MERSWCRNKTEKLVENVPISNAQTNVAIHIGAHIHISDTLYLHRRKRTLTCRHNRSIMLQAIMYGHTYSKTMDQPGMAANPARGQMNREKVDMEAYRYFCCRLSETNKQYT